MAQIPPRVIFTHIPKTAGMTIRSVLYRQYRDTLFSMYGQDEIMFERVTQASETAPEAVRCVSAHIPWGIHKHLKGSDWRYFTLLRDPVRRAISAYAYVRQLPDHPNYQDANTLSLEQYARRYPILGTAQTRYLLGMPAENPARLLESRAPLPGNALALAQHRLKEDYAAFGLTERFDETLLLLRETFGWRNIYYQSRNITTRKPREIEPAALEALCEICAPDTALYDYAKQLFEQRLEQAFGASLADELDAYRRKNALYQRTRDLKQTVYGVLRRFKK